MTNQYPIVVVLCSLTTQVFGLFCPVMRKLIQGIIEFRKKRRPDYVASYAKLALVQSPDALFIACSDSRVVPNLFASTEPGDLFVVRNVGNLVAPCSATGIAESDGAVAAAIEFAVCSLKVSDIIICGHSDCGAMRAILSDHLEIQAPYLKSWIQHAQPALDRFRQGERMKADLESHNHLSQLNVLAQLDHLKSYPIVQEAVTSKRLALHGWWFDLARADVYAWKPAISRFVLIEEVAAD